MSSMDQVFVKAFSRRRLAESDRQDRPSVAAPRESTPTSSQHLDSSNELGSLNVDRTVAGNAEEWLDTLGNQINRADHANQIVPRPHVDLGVTFDAPETGARGAIEAQQKVAHRRVDRTQTNVEAARGAGVKLGAKSLDSSRDASKANELERTLLPSANPDPLQHIHTAYAGMFADASLIAANTSIDGAVEIAAETRTHRPKATDALDRNLSQSETVAQIGSWSEANTSPNNHASKTSSETSTDSIVGVATSVEVESFVDQEDDPVVEMRIDPPVSTQAPEATRSLDSASTYVPFQAVWEVDVFDVPTPVADLFFEGALFQQIAERMSDAVSSGLRSVLVTSSKPGEGRSSVAIGMAMAAAAAGIRVALVDADAESPSLADELRLDLQFGWVDVIRRGLPIKEIAVHAVEDGVTLIPLMPPGVRQAATAFEMVQLMDLLVSNFELIILDGPTGLSPGLQQCASKVDSAVIVRDITRTDELSVCELSNRMFGAGVRGVGVVENFI